MAGTAKQKMSADRCTQVVRLAKAAQPDVFWGQGVTFCDWAYFEAEMQRNGHRFTTPEEYSQAKRTFVREICNKAHKKLQDGFIPN